MLRLRGGGCNQSAEAVKMVAEIAPGVSIDASDVEAILARIEESPPEPKVQAAVLRRVEQLAGIDEHRAHAEANGGALPPSGRWSPRSSPAAPRSSRSSRP